MQRRERKKETATEGEDGVWERITRSKEEKKRVILESNGTLGDRAAPDERKLTGTAKMR